MQRSSDNILNMKYFLGSIHHCNPFLAIEILNFVLALFGYSIISVIYLPTIKFYNLSKFNALVLPFSALIYISITINSAINYFLGLGNVWKERKY